MISDLPAVILGVAPARPGDEPWLPEAPSTRRLAVLCGREARDLGASFGLANLVTRWAVSERTLEASLRSIALGGDSITDPPTREDLRAAAESFEFLPGFRYVLAGSEVVRAFGARVLPARRRGALAWSAGGGGPRLLSWYVSRCGAALAVLPHPSGRNRWFNPPARRAAAAKFLQAAAWSGPEAADALWRAASEEASARRVAA